MTSLGLRMARTRTSCCEAWNWRPSTVSMSMPARGLRCSRTAMSSRSTSRQTVSSSAVAVVWCGSLLEHGGEAEEFAVGGFVDHDFLVILIDGGDAHLAGNHDVGLAAGVAHFVDALARARMFSVRLVRPGRRFHPRRAARRVGRASALQDCRPSNHLAGGFRVGAIRAVRRF